MKIGVLGNSHIGSLKKAWDLLQSEYPDKEIVFFGHRGEGLKALRLEGTRMVPGTPSLRKAIKFTSGGSEFVDTEDFDAILIYALGAREFFLDESKFFSRKVLRQAAVDVTKHSLNSRILRDISGIYRKPIYVGHTPLPARAKGAEDSGCESYLKGVQFIDELIYRPMGARFLPQPIETIVNGNSTDLSYSTGSTRLAVGDKLDNERHPEKEIVHMNEAFGSMWLKNFFAILNADG